jgi:Xaa-Pro dipeptidase
MLHVLAWQRAWKTAYEIDCLRMANKMAVSAHEAARQCFFEGGSELDVHLAFLKDAGIMEYESPYMNIVAFDEKSAILHYQYKDTNRSGKANVMLIDGGVPYHFYGSDLTRTYAKEGTHPVFVRLVDGVEKIQLDLVKHVIPGESYLRIHEKAHEMILDLLIKEDIVRGERAELQAAKVSHLFMPHGIGHLLGLQVHDLAGHYLDETGTLNPPPEEHAFLRLTRIMQEGMVFTIEPGLYFIPVLLDPERQTERGSFLNWSLIDELTPLGGIRVEDNILVTSHGGENLTR